MKEVCANVVAKRIRHKKQRLSKKNDSLCFIDDANLYFWKIFCQFL